MQQKTSDFRKNFSEGLKYARIRRNLTQAALANELQEGETTITNWESGTNGPHRSKLVKIADFFGVEIDPFTGRWEALKPPPAALLGELPPLRTWDRPNPEMSLEEFRDAVDRFAVECHRRGHRLAARTLMDLVDELEEQIKAGAIVPKSPKVAAAIADLSAVRPGKPTT